MYKILEFRPADGEVDQCFESENLSDAIREYAYLTSHYKMRYGEENEDAYSQYFLVQSVDIDINGEDYKSGYNRAADQIASEIKDANAILDELEAIPVNGPMDATLKQASEILRRYRAAGYSYYNDDLMNREKALRKRLGLKEN
jgi:hypothetical protein